MNLTGLMAYLVEDKDVSEPQVGGGVIHYYHTRGEYYVVANGYLVDGLVIQREGAKISVSFYDINNEEVVAIEDAQTGKELPGISMAAAIKTA